MNDQTYHTPDSENPQVNSSSEWRNVDVSTPDGLRALDVIIATRTGYEITIWHNEATLKFQGRLIAQFEDRFTSDPIGMIDRYIPLYTTNINAAILLVTDNDLFFRLDYDWNTVKPSQWQATVESAVRGRRKATTPALAICLAWLDYMDAVTNAQQAADGAGGAE